MSDAVHGPSAETSSFPRPRFPVERPVRRDEQVLAQTGRVMEHLRAQLAELDRREKTLNEQLATLDQETRSLRIWSQQFTEEAQKRERELRVTERRITEREQTAERHFQELQERELEIARQIEALASERATMKSGVEEELRADRQAIAAERLEAQEYRAAQDEIIARERSELDRERDERFAAVEEREQVVSRHETELTRRENDLEKRTRFHEEHLKRLRNEVAGQKSELEKERQGLRVWSTQVEESIRLRLAHVQRFRDLLEEREKASDEERLLIQQTRRSSEEELIRRRAELEADQAKQTADLESREAALRDQQETIAGQLETVETRQVELDQLQQELEATHLENLELRTAIEHALAMLRTELGEPETTQRLDVARGELARQYARVRELITEQQSATAGLLIELEQERESFRSEREQSAVEIGRRESAIEVREACLIRERGQHHAGEAHWIAARDRWRAEKLEAETIIRGLVTELETLLSERPAPPRADEVASQTHTEAA